MQDLNEEEVKTLSKYVFKELFNSSLHLAAKILFEVNEEPNEDRLKSFTEEIFNANSFLMKNYRKLLIKKTFL